MGTPRAAPALAAAQYMVSQGNPATSSMQLGCPCGLDVGTWQIKPGGSNLRVNDPLVVRCKGRAGGLPPTSISGRFDPPHNKCKTSSTQPPAAPFSYRPGKSTTGYCSPWVKRRNEKRTKTR